MSDSTQPKGKVFLVGAGPGDADLITVRGLNALRSADVVLYDELTAPGLLSHARADAECINVGKRGHDPPTRSQQEVQALVIELAQDGKRVVRLKGGDPFVFGRGGEEASACAAAGVDFEVIPGISSAIGVPAYAGIPVTDRRHSASFAVVTGHKDPGEVTEATRWDLLAQAADTLVILMGMRRLETLVERILAAGRSPATPAAAIMWGATAGQRTVEAELADLPKRVREAELGAPAVVVVGDVVRLRSELGWYERLPLFGKRVLVTRAEDQSEEMVEALRALGAEPRVMPMIHIEPVADPTELDTALAQLSNYDVLLLTSANAVRQFAARARQQGASLENLDLEVVCVGPHTAATASAEGMRTSLIPQQRFEAEGMLEVIQAELSPDGRRFLLPRSELARETLPEALRAAGAQVDAVTAYRTLPASDQSQELCSLLESGQLDVLTFTSPSTVRHFMDMLTPAARTAALSCVVAAIGRVTAEAAREVGLTPQVVPPQASAPELVAALAEHYAAERSE